MSRNTNRDYLIIVDVKSSAIKEFNKLEFYINDKESHNIFVQLVVKESHDIINKYVPIDNPNLYELTMNIVKPTNEHKRITGKLISLEDGLYEFKLPQDCCDKVGTYKCELETIYNSRVTNSNRIKYRIKKSVLNDLDDIVDAPGYPIVIQLLDKLSDIEQYEEDRRANELARQLAEQQRKAKYNELVADMTNSIETIDNKVIDVENRISTKEQAVDKLIVDTKADIDNYKVAKDIEIDEYKTAKDQQIDQAITNQNNKIDNAIANQNNKIDTAISNQNDRIAVVESNDVVQDNRLDTLENRATQHESRLTDVEAKNTEQDGRLDIVENKNAQQDNRLDVVEGKNIEQDNRLNEIEAIDVAQNTRLDAIEAKNTEQDDRLLDIEKVNKRQDMNLKCLFAESKNNMIDVTEEGNSIYLQNSTVGYTLIDEIQGNTMVNCNKEADKEIILNGNINTQGYSNVTLTEGVDGGLVDVALEGNTLVNVCDQKDPVAITKSYTVETGNHVALQGEYDGKCRPVVTGNTLVNLMPLKPWGTKSGDGSNCAYSNVALNTLPFKPNTTYTTILLNAEGIVISHWMYSLSTEGPAQGTIATFTTVSDISTATSFFHIYFDQHGDTITQEQINDIKVMVLEGDYTNKPIPLYFEGMQSSFEDKVVTQEMVDAGEELAENLGEYKVDYVISQEDGTIGQTKTFYLNSPLLEGDTIEQQGNNVVHIHRSEIRAYETDDELTLPTDMTNTLVSKATPQYEVISQNDTILCDSYANGHLDVDSVVPIEKVEFLHFEEELAYLYPSTQYTLQFVSDKAVTVDITLGGTRLLAQSIVVGLNRITITAPSTLADNKLIINGVGANIKEVVVTQATDQDFGYFEGMKSVGECEDLAVVSSNSDGSQSNTQTLQHEPLRSVGDIKDRYVLIDARWYIERNCGVRAYQEGDIDNYITDMINTVYPLQTPTYEPIDYNPFTVYSDITHISNNSTIPCNMTIKNTGYNCLLKPSTTYTISSNLGLNTVTTPSVLAEDCLRFYDTDTSTITTMKDVTILEGDYTTGKPIPSHFSGIESAFEQEYDEEVGKYKVKIRVQNEDASKENYIEFYINEPLRGIGDTKDKVYVKNDKVVVERNCGSVTLDGSDDEKWDKFGTDTFNNITRYSTKLGNEKPNSNIVSDKFSKKDYRLNEEFIFVGGSSFAIFGISKAKIPSQNTMYLRQWLQQNPITVVYLLAEPTYEEAEYNDVKLFIESFKNSTLFYNSNVPVTSTVHYSYSVPIVDTVAQTANVTDQQDSMIIDLATQVAVMEMMLM